MFFKKMKIGLILLTFLINFNNAQQYDDNSTKHPDVESRPRHFLYADVPQLTFASSTGSIRELEGILKSGFDPDTPDWLGQTALHMAAKFQQYRSAQMLLDYGANHSSRNWEYEETPLHLAAKTGSLDIMKILLEKGADVHAKISKDLIPGGTPLLYAAMYDSAAADSMKLLLDSGAEVNEVNSYNETPLHTCVKNQNIRAATLLLDKYNADVDSKDGEGCTPLNVFSRDSTIWHSAQVPMLSILLDHRADKESKCRRSGRTPLQNAVAKGNLPVVEYLLKRGANKECVDSHGMTPLYTAVVDNFRKLITSKIANAHLYHKVDNNLEIIRVLLQHGANPNAGVLRRLANRLRQKTTTASSPDDDSSSGEGNQDDELDGDGKSKSTTWTCRTIMLGLASLPKPKPGKSALLPGLINAAKLLVAYGAELSPNRTTCPHLNPVQLARKKNIELSDFLWLLVVDRKAALGPIDNLFSPAVISPGSRSSATADLYVPTHGSTSSLNMPPLIMATNLGDMGQVARLLVSPLTLNRDNDSSSNGSAESHSHHQSAVSYAVGLVKQKDYLGQTALHIAAANKQLSVARILLHLGADPNADDHTGATPLHNAARNGNTAMVELLLQYGAKLEAVASEGTPLTYAVTHSTKPECVQALLEHGADIDANGHNPSLLHVATTRQNIRMMGLLLKYGALINAKTKKSKLTPLGFLIESDCCYPQLPVVGYLLDNGADIDARDVNKRTPLNAALALKKRKELVMYLLNRGADPNTLNVHGCNAPLYRAVTLTSRRVSRYYRHTLSVEPAKRDADILEIVQELLARGAVPDRTDDCFLETALDVAIYTGQQDVIKVLQKATSKDNENETNNQLDVYDHKNYYVDDQYDFEY